MWAFSGDTCKFIYKQNFTEFVEDAHETARDLPTSFYGMALHGESWELEGNMTLVGNDPESCWIATQIMKTTSSDGRMRRWQWGACTASRPDTPPQCDALCLMCHPTASSMKHARVVFAELRKHRRPPLRGAWYVESIGSSDRLGNFEID